MKNVLVALLVCLLVLVPLAGQEGPAFQTKITDTLPVEQVWAAITDAPLEEGLSALSLSPVGEDRYRVNAHNGTADRQASVWAELEVAGRVAIDAYTQGSGEIVATREMIAGTLRSPYGELHLVALLARLSIAEDVGTEALILVPVQIVGSAEAGLEEIALIEGLVREGGPPAGPVPHRAACRPTYPECVGVCRSTLASAESGCWWDLILGSGLGLIGEVIGCAVGCGLLSGPAVGFCLTGCGLVVGSDAYSAVSTYLSCKNGAQTTYLSCTSRCDTNLLGG